MKQDQFLTVVDRDEAERRFKGALGELSPSRSELVSLDDALGRILAEDIASPVDVPGFDRANVDGYAVRSADTFGATEHSPVRLARLREAVQMGCIPRSAVQAGTAMAIPTGGVVPRGADAIVMVEHTRPDGDHVIISKAVTPGRWITYAGTDIASGEVVLRARDLLTSRELGVMAAMGLSEVRVFCRPRVAILSTGDELIAPGKPISPGQIYDSNAVILAGAVRECGGEPIVLGIVPDEQQPLRDAIVRGLAQADMVLLSGGTSKGPGDVNVRVLGELLQPPGIVAHGVALKPGKPICLAVSGRKGVVVLPGFPTSAIFTFHEFVAPVLRALAGRDTPNAPQTGSNHSAGRGLLPAVTRARLPFRVSSESGRTEYVLVRLTENDQGTLIAYPIGKGSGSVTTFSHADGFFVIAQNVELVDEGEDVEIFPIAGERARKADIVVIGSHCVGLDILLHRLSARGITSKLISVGSEGGLAALQRGECDVAGMHLYHAETNTYNTPFLTPGIELVGGYGRMQAVVFRPGDARFEGRQAEQAVREAARTKGVVMINRNRGSGTRALSDRLLADARPPGYAVEASSHHAIAAAVAQGRADFGIAIDIVAREHGMAFLPLCEERFDFAVSKSRRARPAVRAFIEVLHEPETRAMLRERGLLP